MSSSEAASLLSQAPTYYVPDVEQRVLPAAQLVEPLTPRLAPLALVAPAAVGRAVAQLGSEES